MIVWLARGLTRLVALVLLPLLAVVALAAAAAALAGGALAEDAARSIASPRHPAPSATHSWRDDRHAGRAARRRHRARGRPHPVHRVLVPRKERDVPLAGDSQLGVRRRALRQALRHATESVRGVRDARVRLRIGRVRPGGRVSVRATGPPAPIGRRSPPASPSGSIRSPAPSACGPACAPALLTTERRRCDDAAPAPRAPTGFPPPSGRS